ncbi:hypothetical protein U9M48_011486 [Paspalum notatum var. saurae]|uniref:Uncharacterized protein n=1 Tax=Paspalum notatum var. saurae TaxID=547442 RepID=A0AAQ3WHK5_PASNO
MMSPPTASLLFITNCDLKFPLRETISNSILLWTYVELILFSTWFVN